ncbi:hypothetical protein CCR86_15690 [Afifella marina]|nr:hypothetical protein [Afifella marina]MBK5918880.1 hypothetical protein [Afifella marina]
MVKIIMSGMINVIIVWIYLYFFKEKVTDVFADGASPAVALLINIVAAAILTVILFTCIYVIYWVLYMVFAYIKRIY